MEPLGVVIPRSVEDIVATVQIAAEMQVPITARGGGTSLSGQSIGPGIVLDCSKYLNTILDIDRVRSRRPYPAGRRPRFAQPRRWPNTICNSVRTWPPPAGRTSAA